ncbi:MAG TPA: hypothetical protein VKM55_18225 [Candidatus Lokiarchaeia archaeon]|nr:hypothetical protein [Candidatus Lokiarchaeia archaeon]
MEFQIVLESEDSTSIFIDMSATVILILITIIAGSIAFKFKTRTLLWFFLLYLSGSTLMLMDQLSFLLMDVSLLKITYSVVISTELVCLILFESHAMKTSTSMPLLLFSTFLIIGIFYICWNPGNNIAVVGSTFVIDEVAFLFVMYGMVVAITIVYFYWVLCTFIQAPQFVKKPAMLLLLGGILILLSNLFYNLIQVDIVIFLEIIGHGMICLVIYMHPGIVSFLPYKARYIAILTRDGQLVFDQWWYKGPAKTSLEDENITAREDVTNAILIAAIKKVGAIIDEASHKHHVIEIEAGDQVYMITNASRHFLVGLVARQSSMALQEGLTSFVQMVDKIFEESRESITPVFLDKIEAILNYHALNAKTIFVLP